jgi:ribosomal protein S18 acetylase RimI-like enzyme
MSIPVTDARDNARRVTSLLDDKLYEFNIRATGFADWAELCFVVSGEDGEMIAAIAGDSWGGCCEVRHLWVAEGHRRRGYGRTLLTAAEDEARRRGCRRVVVTTHSFQAPGFYQRLGYRHIATVEGYPEGHAKLTFIKPLP